MINDRDVVDHINSYYDAGVNNCYLCEKALHAFMITPFLQLSDDSLKQICEECSDRQFPGWEED